MTLFRTACVVGLVLAGSMLDPPAVWAEKPLLVPRLIVTRGVPWDWAGPDWREPYSVALIAVPNDKSDAHSFDFASNLDCELIEARIAANTEFDPEYVAELATFVCYSPSGATAIKQKPLHATMGDVEPDNSQVYWVGSLPPPGARAKSGPDGNIVFLGAFGIEQLTASSDPLNCPGHSDCGSFRIVQSGADDILHFAIGCLERSQRSKAMREWTSFAGTESQKRRPLLTTSWHICFSLTSARCPRNLPTAGTKEMF